MQGKLLEPGEKRAIVCVNRYFDRNKRDFGLTGPSVQLATDALEASVSTVKKIMADFRLDPSLLNKAPEPKGRPSHAIDSFHEGAIRSFIRDATRTGDTSQYQLFRISFERRLQIATFTQLL